MFLNSLNRPDGGLQIVLPLFVQIGDHLFIKKGLR